VRLKADAHMVRGKPVPHRCAILRVPCGC